MIEEGTYEFFPIEKYWELGCEETEMKITSCFLLPDQVESIFKKADGAEIWAAFETIMPDKSSDYHSVCLGGGFNSAESLALVIQEVQVGLGFWLSASGVGTTWKKFKFVDAEE